MIVIGIDPHKKTHTAVAVTTHDGRVVDTVTVAARAAGHADLLRFAERLGRRRCFALEDVRQVSGGSSASCSAAASAWCAFHPS